jgi:hypothetical protein
MPTSAAKILLQCLWRWCRMHNTGPSCIGKENMSILCTNATWPHSIFERSRLVPLRFQQSMLSSVTLSRLY